MAKLSNGDDIVNYLTSSSFVSNGLRSFCEYRPLGIKEATKGKVGANVIRVKPGPRELGEAHVHLVEFQFSYVLKGWAIVEYEGLGQRRLVEGAAVFQPPGIRHREIDVSDDYEVLEITMPAEFETRNAE